MAGKSKEELEQTQEHNRRVLRELLFDSSKWVSTQHAIRLLLPFFESPLQAAVGLHKKIRSGASPWATRSARLRDGLPVSHPITRYPPPENLDAVTPESLISGMREISEGDNTVVRYWDFVDLQSFNKWLGVLAEYRRQRVTEKSKPQPGDKSKQDQPSRAEQAENRQGAASELEKVAQVDRPPSHRELMIIDILRPHFPAGLSTDDIPGKLGIIKSQWAAQRKAPLGETSRPVDYNPPNKMTIRRAILKFLKHPEYFPNRR
jgi:hypothetical protein